MVVLIVLTLFISKPKFRKIQAFKIEEITDGVLKANANLQVENSNWFSIRGKALTVDLAYKNHLFAKAFSSKFQLKRKETSNLHLDFELYLDSLENNFKYILLKDSFEVVASLSSSVSFLNIPVSEKQTIWLKTQSILDPLVKSVMSKKGIHLKSIALKSLDLKQSVFDVEFSFENKFPIPIEIKYIECSVLPESEALLSVADARFILNQLIQPKQKANCKGVVEVNNFQSIFVGLKKMLSRKTDAYLIGKALIAMEGHEIYIPIEQHIQINLLTQQVTIVKDDK